LKVESLPEYNTNTYKKCFVSVYLVTAIVIGLDKNI